MTTKWFIALTLVITIYLNSAEVKDDSQFVLQSSTQVNPQGDPVNTIAYASDTNQLYSGSSGNWEGVKIWDVATRECIKTVRAYWVESMCYSSKQHQLAVGADQELKILNQEGKCIYTSPSAGDNICSSDYSSTGERLSYGSNQLTVIDTNRHASVFKSPLDRVPVRSIRYSPDDLIIAAGLENGKICLIDTRSTQKPRQYDAEKSIYALDWYDNITLAFGSNSNNVHIEEVRSNYRQELSGHTDPGIYAVRYSPDKTTIASGCWDKTIKIWDAKTYACLETLTGHDGAVRSISWIDNDTLASGSYDGTIKVWKKNNTSGSDDEED